MKKLLLFFIMFISLSICVKAASVSPDIQVDKIYVDGKEVSESPAKNSGYYFSKTECNNGVQSSWNNETWELELSNIKQASSCKVYFTSKVEEAAKETKKNIENPNTGAFANISIIICGLLIASGIAVVIIRKKKFYRI